jgi:hypothetical protein
MAALSLINRDYAATLATAEKMVLGIRLPGYKTGYCQILMALIKKKNASRSHDSTSSLEKPTHGPFPLFTPNLVEFNPQNLTLGLTIF